MIQLLNINNKMQKSQQSQQVRREKQKSKQGLLKYLSKEKTYKVQYQIVKQMLKIMQNPKPDSFNDNFKYLYNNISKQMTKTLLFSTLNYKIWNNQSLPVQIRDKTQFFRIVSDWIEIYQLKVSDLKKLKDQIQFIFQFFKKNTNYLFEKVVLIDEIHQDLVQLLGRQFWGLKQLDQKQQQQQEQQKQRQKQRQRQATRQEATQFLKLLQNLVDYYAFYENNQNHCWYNCQLYLLQQKSARYKQFIVKCLQYVLSVNSGKKSPDRYLQKHQQMQLTRLALIFLQRPDLQNQQSIKLIKLLMMRTSKIVRYAMVVDYVRLYEYYQKSNQQRIIEQLQNMVYFRELIIGQNQIGQAGLMSTHLGKSLQILNIPARSKHRLILTHEAYFGKCSILQLQVLIEGGDISIGMYTLKNGKQTEYWKQDRTQDRRVDILLKQQGLYIVQFNNTYSWMKGKKISYRIEQFCIGI